jgi:3-methyl-2-oxobutanoate hydroxymethyltransferase
LAADISSKLDITVIGIGAGRGTDAQVLVLHDMLGMTDSAPKFVQNFMDGAPSIQAALKAFVDAVKSGDYPKDEHIYS